MLAVMEGPAALLRRTRTAVGLSSRSLAARAGVPASTVTRIETGRVDPTTAMLRRLLAAAGHELRLEAAPLPAPRAPELADLADAVLPGATVGDRPDWTRLRAFLDHLAQQPEQVATAIARRPPASGSVLLDALLAGTAEKVADDAGIPRPAWTADVAAIDPPWCAPGTPRMQARFHDEAPQQLLDRGIAVDAGSLWRERPALPA